MNAAQRRRVKQLINNSLHTMGFQYHDSIPLVAIQELLNTYDLHLEPGIYCGHDGHSLEPVGENLYLSLSWHRMDVTKRWEITAYVS